MINTYTRGLGVLGSSCFIREVSGSSCFVREGLRHVAGMLLAYVLHVQVWSQLCLHIRTGMMAAVCAYTCRHYREHTPWSRNHTYAQHTSPCSHDYETHQHWHTHASRFRMMVGLRLIHTKTLASLRQNGCVKVLVSYAHAYTHIIIHTQMCWHEAYYVQRNRHLQRSWSCVLQEYTCAQVHAQHRLAHHRRAQGMVHPYTCARICMWQSN